MRINRPHHEVRVGPDSLERVAPKGDLVLERMDEGRELAFVLLLQVGRQEPPFGADPVERVLQELARLRILSRAAGVLPKGRLPHARFSRPPRAKSFPWKLPMRPPPAPWIAVTRASQTA